MADYLNNPFPDLGPKTVNRLMQERLEKIVIKGKEVPVIWTDDESRARKEIFPAIYIEFIDLIPADDRQFSGILECEVDQLSDGTNAGSATISYPTAYFINYDVHLQAESIEDIVDLVTEVSRKIPPGGYLFEIDGKFRLAIQRPGTALNADVPEEMFYHRIYSYQVETYLFDYETLEHKKTMIDSGLTIELKDS